jgi:hypothetical protein
MVWRWARLLACSVVVEAACGAVRPAPRRALALLGGLRSRLSRFAAECVHCRDYLMIERAATHCLMYDSISIHRHLMLVIPLQVGGLTALWRNLEIVHNHGGLFAVSAL